MKRILNCIVSVFVILVIIFSFVGCSGGISNNDAKAYTRDFLDAIEAKDYEHAATFLHPERPVDLEPFFEGLKSEENMDFSTIEITKYTGFSSSYYDSTVEGSAYSLSMNVKVGDDEIKMEIEIVKNDNGYGIYNLDIDI
ncbi:MAG: hypothetical protein HFE77_03825 [Clostridiales bacterium]|nr:hypothetical protein [Clostridiales bacterium]